MQEANATFHSNLYSTRQGAAPVHSCQRALEAWKKKELKKPYLPLRQTNPFQCGSDRP